MRKIGVVVALTLPSTSLIQYVHSHVVDSDRRMVNTMDDDNDTQYLRRNAPTRSRRYPLHIIEDSNNAERLSTGSSLIHEKEANIIVDGKPHSQVSYGSRVIDDRIHKIQNKERRLTTKPKGRANHRHRNKQILVERIHINLLRNGGPTTITAMSEEVDVSNPVK